MMLSSYLLKPNLIHGNLISYKSQGLLLLGPSGAGKSILSYQLIQKGAKLISDDIVAVDDQAIGFAPEEGYGHIEIFGLGIIQLSPLQCSSSILINHIFFHKDIPDRLYEKQTLKIGKNTIHYSFCNFNHHFTADYITVFCDTLNSKQLIKNIL